MKTSSCVCVFFSLGKPDPCERIVVLEITRNSATVGWVKPARNGGAKIDGYVIEYIEVKPPPEQEVCHVIQYWNCHDTTPTLRSVTHITIFIVMDTELEKIATKCLLNDMTKNRIY